MQNKIILPILLILLFAGCRGKREIMGTTPYESNATVAEFFSSMQKQSYDFQTLSAKTEVEFKMSGQELSSRVDIKIIKDTIIQLSIQPLLGIEAIKIKFGADSIKVIDRVNKQYSFESYNKFKKQTQFDFNFFNLQALFTNQIFVPGTSKLNPEFYDRFNIVNEGTISRIQINDASRMQYTFISEKGEKLLSTNIDDTDMRYNLKWQYSDFKSNDGQTFPMQMNLQISDKEKPALFAAEIFFSRIQKDVPVNKEFIIPKNYKKVDFSELIKSLGIK